jgi:uncharacterized protein
MTLHPTIWYFGYIRSDLFCQVTITAYMLKPQREDLMNPITKFIKRHPMVTFWGIAWSTSFLGFFMNERNPEGLWGFLLYGPFVGGILVTAFADGSSGLKTYFSRMVRWRVGIQWYVAALFIPPVLRLAAFGLNIISGAAAPTSIQWPAWIDVFFEAFLLISLAEEPGFRGFALPRLMEGRSALSASLILGVFHSIWHLPLFILGSDSPIIIPIIISGAILNTWLFNNTKGSVLLAMLLHTSVHFMVYIFNPLFSGADAQRQTIWLAVVFVAMAILLPILSGRELGRKREPIVRAVVAKHPLAAK